MGVACTRPIERVLAALGKLPGGASTQFESCRDVSYGGVLCALPALAANGLFRHLQTTFPTLSGYYTTLHVILLLAYMALCRIRTVEQLQYESPGELGKLMGLDRVPEVRCLRKKVTQLSQGQDDKAPEIWAGLLSKDWMERRAGVGRHAVCRRPRASLSRQEDGIAASLCVSPTVVLARHDRLLGQRCVGPTVLFDRAADRSRHARSHRKRHRASAAERRAGQPTKEQLEADPLSQSLPADLRPGRLQPVFLPPHVAGAPHRLHHLPQIPQGGLARIGVLGSHRDDAQRRSGHDEVGRARFVGRCAGWPVDARGPQADFQRPSDQPDQHGLRSGRLAGCGGAVQPMVSGKLLPLHDGTLCH